MNRRSLTRLVPALAALAILAGVEPVSAYSVMTAQGTGLELRWTSLPMKFNIHTAVPPGVAAADYYNAIRAAYQTWSNVSCSYYASADQGTVSLPSGNDSDMVNTNVFLSSWPLSYGQQALAITLTKYDPTTGKILDADVHYNPSYSWDTNGSPYKIDLQSVATHEAGHQLGLDHSTNPDATMFSYTTGQGDTSQRSLHSDDIAGICYLYPTGQPAPPECTDPSHCAPSETCVNGACVLAVQKGYGSTCSSEKDCTSSICIAYGTTTFCSQMCDAANPCPYGDKCLPLQGGGSACLPNSASMGSKLLGEPCQANLDCETNICVSVPGAGYLCSQSCDVAQNNCPTGFNCAPTTSGGGLCVPIVTEPPPPPPPAEKEFGEACANHAECASKVCVQTCTQWCDLANAGACPAGYECKAVAGTEDGVCMPAGTSAPAPGELGASCTEHADCNSGICADANGVKFCTVLCDPEQGCAEGYDCISAGGDKFACSPAVVELDDGCSLGPFRIQAAQTVLLIFLLPLILLARRRR